MDILDYIESLCFRNYTIPRPHLVVSCSFGFRRSLSQRAGERRNPNEHETTK